MTIPSSSVLSSDAIAATRLCASKMSGRNSAVKRPLGKKVSTDDHDALSVNSVARLDPAASIQAPHVLVDGRSRGHSR